MKAHELLAARVAAFYKDHKTSIRPDEFSLVVDACIRVIAKEGLYPIFNDTLMIKGIKSEACRILGRHGGLVTARNKRLQVLVNMVEQDSEPAIVWVPQDGWLFNPKELGVKVKT